MEKRFCGKCGKPVAECTCGDCGGEKKGTGFGKSHAPKETGEHSGAYFRKKFENITLSEGEVAVRQYHIGTIGKNILSQNSQGDSCILVTNKRIISMSDCEYMGSSSTSLEEISIDSIIGVKNYYAVGMTGWKVAAGLTLILLGLSFLAIGFGEGNLIAILMSIAMMVLAGKLIKECKKPSYLFSIYASTTSEAMLMGANLRGKLLNSQGYGVVFQYTPTTEAVTMMRELGACIMDIKAKGDYAVEMWKKV